MDKLVNKDFYNIIKNKVFIKPIGIHFWTTYLDIQDFQNITDLYEFIFKILLENKLKIFRCNIIAIYYSNQITSVQMENIN